LPVSLKEPVELSPVAGVRLATCNASIYDNNRDDISLIEISENSSCAAVFTKNAFCAAPVVIARKHLDQNTPLYCLINAGNANAGTGGRGHNDALLCCQLLATQLGCQPDQILPFSTGVIGEYLPMENIKESFPKLQKTLSDNNWLASAHAIKTTDTVAKGISKSVLLGNKAVQITGIAKGSGMIRPDMATMLAYIATDAGVDSNLLNKVLNKAVERSFNRICVDGDTSTNDACLLIATGKSEIKIENENDPLLIHLQNEIDSVCIELAQMIVRDGEGATKFVSVIVQGGSSAVLCQDIAYDIATSPLVKTALFASDPNWGRIIAAVGRSRVAQIDAEKISIYLDEVCIVENGEKAESYTEKDGQDVMSREEIVIRIDLGQGQCSETVWTCDLSHDYIKINAEYRS
jgi:glutamate N-acetyltransferase / amino-acid N-acetyltransferase